MFSTMSASPASAAEVSAMRAAKVSKVMAVASSKKGTPYRWGASGPRAFDCSGFTRWVYGKVGVKLPHSSKMQVSKVKKTRKPKVGDLVFFYSGRHHVYHVGIYAGKHQIWHAPHAGAKVRKERIWTSRVMYGDVRGI